VSETLSKKLKKDLFLATPSHPHHLLATIHLGHNAPLLQVPSLTLPSSSTTISQPPDLINLPHHLSNHNTPDNKISAPMVANTVMMILSKV